MMNSYYEVFRTGGSPAPDVDQAEKRVLDYLLTPSCDIREKAERRMYYDSCGKKIGYFDDTKKYGIIIEKQDIIEFDDGDLGTYDFSDFLCLKTNLKTKYTLQDHRCAKYELSFLLEKDGYYYYIDSKSPYGGLKNVGTNATNFIFFTPVKENMKVELYLLYEKCIEFSQVKVE